MQTTGITKPLDRRLLLQQRLTRRDTSECSSHSQNRDSIGASSEPISLPGRRPASETLSNVVAPKSLPNSRQSIDELLVQQLRDEYESKLERLLTFTLDSLKRFTDVQHEVDTIELTQTQQRLRTIATFVSNSPKWVGGLEVEPVDRQIEFLNHRLSDLSAQKTKSDPLIAQCKSTLSLELKGQRQLRKQLEDERREFEIRLRLAGDEGQSEYQRNQRLAGGQFILMQYIGRGGFSEVWLAFDAIDIQNLALKIQRMNPQ
jgi:hypothetical protein